ncbi:MAG: molybdopterin-guanine dinucleotide biosynthesis protein B [Hyphomicrobiaceae bacterium]
MTTLVGGSPTPVVAIVGWKNSGKTTLVVRLVEELVSRGCNVATVKHAHHTFQIDQGESDSARHRRAGARQVAVISQERLAIIKEFAGAAEPGLHRILQMLDPCDLVIAEGYKRSAIPKIEARRHGSASREPLARDDPHVIAIAADHATEGDGRPVYNLDDVAGLADLILRDVMGRRDLQRPPSGAG